MSNMIIEKREDGTWFFIDLSGKRYQFFQVIKWTKTEIIISISENGESMICFTSIPFAKDIFDGAVIHFIENDKKRLYTYWVGNDFDTIKGFNVKENRKPRFKKVEIKEDDKISTNPNTALSHSYKKKTKVRETKIIDKPRIISIDDLVKHEIAEDMHKQVNKNFNAIQSIKEILLKKSKEKKVTKPRKKKEQNK